MTEATKGVGQRDTKMATKDFFLFDDWFYPNKLEEAAIEVGADIIGMVKTNIKVLSE